jgi:hypothetical protein
VFNIKDMRFARPWLRRMSSSGITRRVAPVRSDVSDEHIASIIRVTIIGELGATLAVTSNRSTLFHPKLRSLGEPHSVIFLKTAFICLMFVWNISYCLFWPAFFMFRWQHYQEQIVIFRLEVIMDYEECRLLECDVVWLTASHPKRKHSR